MRSLILARRARLAPAPHAAFLPCTPPYETPRTRWTKPSRSTPTRPGRSARARRSSRARPERKTTTAATSVDGRAPAAAAKKPRAGMSSTAINALRAAVDAFVARVTSPATGRKAPWPLADLVPLAVRDDAQEYLKKTKAHELRALYARVETSFETLVRFPLTKEAYGKLDRFVRAFPGCDARRREVGAGGEAEGGVRVRARRGALRRRRRHRGGRRRGEGRPRVGREGADHGPRRHPHGVSESERESESARREQKRHEGPNERRSTKKWMKKKRRRRHPRAGIKPFISMRFRFDGRGTRRGCFGRPSAAAGLAAALALLSFVPNDDPPCAAIFRTITVSVLGGALFFSSSPPPSEEPPSEEPPSSSPPASMASVRRAMSAAFNPVVREPASFEHLLERGHLHLAHVRPAAPLCSSSVDRVLFFVRFFPSPPLASSSSVVVVVVVDDHLHRLLRPPRAPSVPAAPRSALNAALHASTD